MIGLNHIAEMSVVSNLITGKKYTEVIKMKKNFFSSLISLLLMIIVILATAASPVSARTWQEYYNQETGTAFAYPITWRLVEDVTKTALNGQVIGTKTVVKAYDPKGNACVYFKVHASYPLNILKKQDIKLTRYEKLGKSSTYLVENGTNMSLYALPKNGWTPSTKEYAPENFHPVISTYDGIWSFSSTEELFPFVRKDDLSDEDKELVRQILLSACSGHIDIEAMNKAEASKKDENRYYADGYYDSSGHWHNYPK